MTKKRGSSTSTSTRKHISAGGTAAWKKSPLVGGILALVIIISLWKVLFSGDAANTSLIPEEFPHTYLAAEDNGKYDALLVKRGKTDMKTPFTENGKEYWEAYICRNAGCPGRKKGSDKPYLFSGVRPQQPEGGQAGGGPNSSGMMYQMVSCPQCKAAYSKLSSKKKEGFDLTAVERYHNDEAKKMLDQIREEYKKRAAK